MAFKDITKVAYPREDGKHTIKIDYKDKAHRYYIRPRIDFERDETDAKAWGKVLKGVAGTTTLMGDTLEKKGLMNYALNKAMMYLFGFYEFKDENGERKIGYSKKGEQSMWDGENLQALSRDEALEVLSYGSKASQRHTKQGGKIGSVVHDAIEHYITKDDSIFDIADQYIANIREADYDSENEREHDLKNFQGDVEMAKLAFNRFCLWWETVRPTLYAAEDILYSEKYNVAGSLDADLGIPIEHHPKPELFPGKTHVRCLTDWKTSNASDSKDAAAPEGVYYTYFLQDAIYEIMRREMGLEPVDDLVVVSARKDGNFSILFASELGLTVDECIEWAKCVILCHKMMKKIKAALNEHGESAPRPTNDKVRLIDEEF